MTSFMQHLRSQGALEAAGETAQSRRAALPPAPGGAEAAPGVPPLGPSKPWEGWGSQGGGTQSR